ncbi:MAG TPA: hypothetical protein VFQ20_07315 [Burkholderiaceae bacterium]|nr:hypothetical protein [Burkholderiaceae bacterium]
MLPQRPTEQSNRLVDQAAQVADDAIHATQRAADNALEGLAGSVQDARRQAAPLLNAATEQASALARRGVDALRESSQNLRDSAVHATDRATLYVKDEPLKAMLIAAATGAALMALVGLLTRSRDRA